VIRLDEPPGFATGSRKWFPTCAMALVVSFTLACSRAQESTPGGWTIAQAESITVIRGMPVRVRACRGIGRREGRRYRRFDCLAGARRKEESFESVAVLYELRPLGRFDGADSSYKLMNVRFIGGPGIP
jgi:hypothetical protein